MAGSPLQFGASNANGGLHLPSPFSLRIQQSDGSTASKGNSLVPDEELCVGAVLNASILVVEDTSGRSVRLALSELANINKVERKLKLTRDNKEIKSTSDEGKSRSVDDEITHVTLRIRFDNDRRGRLVGSSSSGHDNGESLDSADDHGRIHLMTLGLSVLVVVASSVFLMSTSEELQGPVGIWATCMVVGTAILGFLAFMDGHKIRTSTKANGSNGNDVWRIMYVALLDDSGEIAEHNKKKIENKQGVWDFTRMMEVLGYKNPTERPELMAHIPVDKETPQRWLNCEKGNPNLARKRWAYTTKFRKNFGFNNILDKPHPLYNVIKQNWDCSYYGRDKTGKHPIFYDKPAGVNMKRFRELGITDADLVYHYVWITEFAYKHLCDNSDDMASCITIYDLKGLDRSLFFGEKKKLLQKTMKIMEQHYPERTFKIRILNGPGWFNWIAWPIVTSIANKQTLEKIKSYGSDFKKFAAEIAQYVELSRVPQEFGGENPLALKESQVRPLIFFST